MATAFIGVIGGSGLYDIDGFSASDEVRVKTPFGDPSDAIVVGDLEGTKVAFLPRHGRGHRFSPTNLPYLANIYALKLLGVDRLVAVTAVGSLREHLHPGKLVVVDQYIDRTVNRPASFFTDGIVGHVGFGDPVSKPLSDMLYHAAVTEGLDVEHGGTYLCIEGPQFSTRAESQLFRSWGADIIGMTNVPEARLAREAELPFASLALVTDYDCWHETEADVTVEAVIATLKTNVTKAKRTLRALAKITAESSTPLVCPSQSALSGAIMTDPACVPTYAREKLAIFLDKYWK
ncbi:MAG: S-methyl-5'-thioadenosine phosphorylase [Myxococcales bacterium]|nr:S-methyl-5'-thioadenosine phosphorylase [Myxococcales bacterium]